MKHIFINPDTYILRAGWRIFVFFIIFMTLNVGLTLGVREILGGLKGGGILSFTLLCISATISAYISRKYIDKKGFTSFGLKKDKAAVLDVISGMVNNASKVGGIYFLMFYS